MDIATLTNAPRVFVLDGLPYKIRALKAREWGELHAWLKDNTDDPVTLAIRQIEKSNRLGAPITAEQENFLLSEARRESRSWPPRISSPTWVQAIGDADGGSDEFLRAIIAAEQPSYTIEQARALGEKLSGEESARLILAAMGIDPSPKLEGPEAIPPARKKRPSPSKTTGRKRSTA